MAGSRGRSGAVTAITGAGRTSAPRSTRSCPCPGQTPPPAPTREPWSASPPASAGTGPSPASRTTSWRARPGNCGGSWPRAPGTGTSPPCARSSRGAATTAGPPGTCAWPPAGARWPPTTRRPSRCPSWSGCGAIATSRCGSGRCGGCCMTPPPAPSQSSAWTCPTSTWPTGRRGHTSRAGTSTSCTSRPPPPGCWRG